jgi:hypothetical protein
LIISDFQFDGFDVEELYPIENATDEGDGRERD